MSDHTPGPWEWNETEEGHEIRMGSSLGSPIDYEVQHIIRYDHELFFDEDDDGDRENRQLAEAEANARLVAASPDLLGVLRRIEFAVKDTPWYRCPACDGIKEGAKGTGHAADCDLAAAITKATGEQ